MRIANIVFFVVFIAGMAWWTMNASSQTRQHCGPVVEIASWLKETHHEAPHFIGKVATVDGSTMTMTLYHNEKTKTWTSVNTRQGLSCVMMYGEDGETPATIDIPKESKEEEAPS